VLPICNNVKSISLNSNSIGDKGIAALASIFKVKGVLPNLQRLLLGGNKIGEAGAADLKEVIASGGLPSCTLINFVDNEASEAAQETVDEAINNRN